MLLNEYRIPEGCQNQWYVFRRSSQISVIPAMRDEVKWFLVDGVEEYIFGL